MAHICMYLAAASVGAAGSGASALPSLARARLVVITSFSGCSATATLVGSAVVAQARAPRSRIDEARVGTRMLAGWLWLACGVVSLLV